MDKRLIPILSLVFLAINFAWLPLLPWNSKIMSPFYAKDYKGDVIYISPPQYLDYAVRALPYLIILALIFYYNPKARNYAVIALLIWIGYIIDYFIFFNEPLRHYEKNLSVVKIWIPLSYSFYMAVGLIIWIWRDYLIKIKKHG